MIPVDHLEGNTWAQRLQSRQRNERRKRWLCWALFLGAVTHTTVIADERGIRFC